MGTLSILFCIYHLKPFIELLTSAWTPCWVTCHRCPCWARAGQDNLSCSVIQLKPRQSFPHVVYFAWMKEVGAAPGLLPQLSTEQLHSYTSVPIFRGVTDAHHTRSCFRLNHKGYPHPPLHGLKKKQTQGTFLIIFLKSSETMKYHKLGVKWKEECHPTACPRAAVLSLVLPFFPVLSSSWGDMLVAVYASGMSRKEMLSGAEREGLMPMQTFAHRLQAARRHQNCETSPPHTHASWQNQLLIWGSHEVTDELLVTAVAPSNRKLCHVFSNQKSCSVRLPPWPGDKAGEQTSSTIPSTQTQYHTGETLAACWVRNTWDVEILLQPPCFPALLHSQH